MDLHGVRASAVWGWRPLVCFACGDACSATGRLVVLDDLHQEALTAGLCARSVCRDLAVDLGIAWGSSGPCRSIRLARALGG